MLDKEEILKVISLCENKLKETKNPKIIEVLEKIIKISTDKEYEDIITDFNSNKTRFCDYFIPDKSLEENIDYFIENYDKDDFEVKIKEFYLYCIINKTKDLVTWLEILPEEEIVNDEENRKDIVEPVTTAIEMLDEIIKNEKEEPLAFLTKDKYKILFSGFTYKDLEGLQPQVINAFLRKIKYSLSTMTLVDGVEIVDHVKEKFGVPLMRVHISKDYRIAFLRDGNVTCIAGLGLKTGKEEDYKKYDNLFKPGKKEEFYERIEAFKKGELSLDDDHFKVIGLIEDKMKKGKLSI